MWQEIRFLFNCISDRQYVTAAADLYRGALTIFWTFAVRLSCLIHDSLQKDMPTCRKKIIL